MDVSAFRYDDVARDIVIDAISQHTGIPVSEDDTLHDLDLDSLERTEILIELEDSCDYAVRDIFPQITREIEIDDKKYHAAKTVHDLVQIVADQLHWAITGSQGC